MPTYSYRCERGHEFEEFQSIVADPLEVCPQCGARAERVISGGTGLIFKGSGFYITDYAKKGGNSKSTTTKTESAKSPDTTSTAKSEKPASGGSAGSSDQ